MANGLFSFPTPFTPPTTEEDELIWLRLIRSRRVGPATFWRLLEEHGSARAALIALPGIAKAAGVEDYQTFSEAEAIAECRAARRAGARMLCRGAPGYPARLAEIADAPPLLWAMGRPDLAARPAVALVGARNASSLGLRMARRLAAGLSAAGLCVASGLARGIDAAAHEAALPGGTVAVLAGGIDRPYPAETAPLAARIAEEGLLLSEQPMGLAPQARHFPLRNRLISGLSEAVVVVEAALRSGSLITAREALDQGREVLAVPGHPVDARTGGCNALIRDGATLVRGPEDVIEALAGLGLSLTPPEVAPSTVPTASPHPSRGGGSLAPPPAAVLSRLRASDAAGPLPAGAATRPPTFTRPPAPPQPRPGPQIAPSAQILHGLILDRLGPGPLAEDQLSRDLGLPPAALAEGLLALELEGQIARAPGGLLARLA